MSLPPAAARSFEQAAAAIRADDAGTGARLLAQCLAQWPGFTEARQLYATVLFQQLGAPAAALPQIDRLIADEPRNAAYRFFRAAVAGQLGDFDTAFADCETALALDPANPAFWLRYGHALRTAGRPADAIAAYRKSLALAPSGEGWWALADTKSVAFDDADVAAMMRLAQAALPPNDAAQLHFALGKAFEDRGEAAKAFAHYERGNALKRSLVPYAAGDLTAYVDRARAVFTPAFFAAREGLGCDAPDPIFVVGLPRSGSTLVEQILASHSQIEGTMELADMIAVAREAMGAGPFDFKRYPGALAGPDGAALNALGQRYLDRTRAYRRAGKPFFIDKMPNNFIHAGLIHLILPRARIVDVRRHPMACCWSAFKQHFASGQPFSYGLADAGLYYADYVRLMAHVDAVLPGRVHRVIYEALVADPETEIRKLFAYVGVPFEERALRFHETKRPVRSASSEQVRQPINAKGLDSWKPFEPWLGPLKAALGPVLNAYPAAP